MKIKTEDMENKRITSLKEFYPLYLQEHSNSTLGFYILLALR